MGTLFELVRGWWQWRREGSDVPARGAQATMAFKFQLLKSLSPAHLLNITLNHLDSLRPLFVGDVEVLQVGALARRPFSTSLGSPGCSRRLMARAAAPRGVLGPCR